VTCSIDGLGNPLKIANKFADVFADACLPFSFDRFVEACTKYNNDRNNTSMYNRSVSFLCSITLVQKVVSQLKRNKAASLNGLTAEHILHSLPVVLSVITRLINLIVKYEYVPDAFGHNTTILLPKDSFSKTQCDSGNYRGITVSPIIFKIFKLCLFQKFGSYLGSEKMQFGFKKKVGTNHAIYSLCKGANYFTENDSTVSFCSLDLTHAFDRLSRYVLFEKLFKKNCPVQFVNIME